MKGGIPFLVSRRLTSGIIGPYGDVHLQWGQKGQCLLFAYSVTASMLGVEKFTHDPTLHTKLHVSDSGTYSYRVQIVLLLALLD